MLTLEKHADGSHPTPASLFDEDGFLLDHALWSEQLARELAELDGVGALGEKHWRVIHHIRDRFLSLGALPNMRLICRATGIPKAEIHGLFGGCLKIWRICGLPNPGEEAKAYLS